MAMGLTRRGFVKGEVFAIYCPNVPEYAIAFLAVASVGGVVSTMNPLSTATEIAGQLRETGAKYLLTVPPFVEWAREAARGSQVREVFVFGEAPGATPFAELLKEDGVPPEVAIDPRNDLLVLPYSSGTSGLPRGVMLTHYNLVAQLCQGDGMYRRGDADVSIAVLPFFHIFGMTLVLLLGLKRGNTLISMPRFELEQFLQCLQKYAVTHAYLVPPIVLALAKHPLIDQYDLSRIKHIGCGAAPLAENIERACAKRLDCEVGQGFGMTEVSGTAIVNPEGAITHGSVGQCLPNMQARIVDIDTGQDAAPGEPGELWLRGPNVMRGYFKQAEATAQVLDADGWLRTGDVARVDADGCFYIIDRVKELIKYKAWQVAPAELEAVLVSHRAVADAAVIPSPDEECGEVPKALVVLKGAATAEELMAYVAERVAPYKKVRRLAIVEAIPRSLSGKILRRVLVEQERMNASATS